MCVNFFVHAPLKFDLASLKIVVYALSVNPHVFLSAVLGYLLTSFWTAFLFHDNLFLLFSGLDFFLKAINEDALAFAIAPNAFISALGLRNLSHSAYPPPESVLLPPPPLPLMSSTKVLSLSSSLSSLSTSSVSSSLTFLKLYDDSYNENSPSCAIETSSLLFSVVEHDVFTVVDPVVFMAVLKTFILFVTGGAFFLFVLIFFVFVAQRRFEGLSDPCCDGFLALLVTLQVFIILLFLFASRDAFVVRLYHRCHPCLFSCSVF